MSKGYLYVAPVAQPKETMAEKFGNLGNQMAAAQKANQAAQMKRVQDLNKQRNQQLTQLMGPLKNTENWSQRDLEVLQSLTSQGMEMLRQDPTKYQDILMELWTFHGLGDTQSKVKRGLNPEDERYIEYQMGEREWPVDGYSAVTSEQDYQLRNQSYDQMFEETGEYTSPSGLVYPSGNYYVPGTRTTMIDQLTNRTMSEGDALFGAQIELMEKPNGTTVAVAMKDGQAVAEQVVAGPANLFPARGSGGYYTPRSVSTSFVTPTETVKDLNTVISNLRGQVNANEISESEAVSRLRVAISDDYNAQKFGAGLRAASMEMWKEKYPDQEYDPEMFKVEEGAQDSYAARHGIKSPLEVYQDAVLALADLAKDPNRSSQGRANDFPASRNSWRGMVGLPEGLVEDLSPDNPRSGLYGETAEMFANIGPNDKRAEIFIGSENLEFVDPNNPQGATYFGTVFGIPSANVVLLEKAAEDYEGVVADGMPADLANKHMNDNLTNVYWATPPSQRFVAIPIFKDETMKEFTAEYMKLSQNFQNRYKNDPTVVSDDDPQRDTLFNEIMRLAK